MIITLIGMPGSGKTCMGRSLSKKLGMRVIDGDKFIEQRYGLPLHEIISREGLEGFKKIEEQTLLSIEDDDVILSPGGSAVYYESFMQKCSDRGVVVYLYTGPKTTLERIGDYSKRGVVLKEGQTIEDLFSEREPLYKKWAHIVVDCDGRAFARYKRVAENEIKKYINKNAARFTKDQKVQE
ncbi:MAG: shikimate kinase [Clostridia bacterium]|nr:shikimate kinase [Clostridia bacterium]